jgi:hypothetical protein
MAMPSRSFEVCATALTVGGMALIFNAKSAIREMGFLPLLRDFGEARPIMTFGMGRTTVVGMALYTVRF